MSYIWHTFFFDPVYNLLVFFIDIFPHGDVGLAIIAAVVVVKIILFPLSIKAIKTQRIMKEIDPKLREIKEKYKDDREAQARAMMEVYREAGMNPLASIVVMFIQIPFIIALYLAIVRGGGVVLPEINTDILYTFVKVPTEVSMLFLGNMDVAARSLPLALLAGITQYFATKASLPAMAPRKEGETPTFKEDFARNMQLQMRYVLPVIIFIVAYSFSATIALYLFVSNLVILAQEVIVRKHR